MAQFDPVTLDFLKSLYAKIPALTCIKGCHDCCGPAIWQKDEWLSMTDVRAAQNDTCPYAGQDGCDCHDKRPMLCRLFGASVELKCPHQRGPERLLTRDETRQIMAQYISTFRG